MHTELRPETEGALLLDQNQHGRRGPAAPRALSCSRRLNIARTTNLNNFMPIARSRTGDASFKCLPYQLSMVGYAPTMVVTGNGESGFDSGEGA